MSDSKDEVSAPSLTDFKMIVVVHSNIVIWFVFMFYAYIFYFLFVSFFDCVTVCHDVYLFLPTVQEAIWKTEKTRLIHVVKTCIVILVND